jgi:negative regulator of flagellin synthesis FlgM
MQINGKGRIDPSLVAGVTPSVTDRQAPARQQSTGAAPERPKTDSVQFSDEGRALASGAGLQAAAGAERVAEVRQRMLRGAYNTAEMAGEVAKRILQRGDI